jgi:alkylated DNA repair dioxygenase AlkB
VVSVTLNLLPPQNLLPADGEAINHGSIFDLSEADQLFTQLLDELPWQHDVVKMFGKTITTARKVAWYGDSGLNYTYSGKTKTPLPWNELLTQLKACVESATGETFNSCLLNLYHDGSEGMSWHRDNESTIVKNSAIACLSFGARRKFHFKHTATKERITTELEHGSLLVMAGLIQTHWLHALPKTAKITQARISLTFRQMKVSTIA